MGSRWPRKSAFAEFSVSAIRILWSSKFLAIGMPWMPTWNHIGSMSSMVSGYFDGCEFHHVPRAENEAADTLSKLGSSRASYPGGYCI